MKDYYAILQLSRSASEKEIKLAYRRLVQQYHPDVNPDPLAEEFIKEINEAYEVLGDFNKRRGYDFLLDYPQAANILEQQPKPHRDPAYRRKNTHRPTGPSEESRLQEFMLRWLPLSKKIAWMGCIMCAILVLDVSVPHHVTGAQVRTFTSNTLPRSQSTFIITASGGRLKVSGEDMAAFNKGQLIEVIESGIFSILIEIKIPETKKSITNLSTIYRNYFFVPLMLLILSVLGLLVKEGIEYRFNLGLVNFIVLIFTLILIFK